MNQASTSQETHFSIDESNLQGLAFHDKPMHKLDPYEVRIGDEELFFKAKGGFKAFNLSMTQSEIIYKNDLFWKEKEIKNMHH